MCQDGYPSRDVELIYGPVASGIDSLKAQASRSAHYGLLVLVGLVGLFTQLSDDLLPYPAKFVLSGFFVFIGGLSTFISVYHAVRSEELIIGRRKILKRLESDYLNERTIELLDDSRPKPLVRYYTWRCDWDFLVPFLVSLLLGYVLFVFYLLVSVKASGIFLALMVLVAIGFFGASCFPIGKLTCDMGDDCSA